MNAFGTHDMAFLRGEYPKAARKHMPPPEKHTKRPVRALREASIERASERTAYLFERHCKNLDKHLKALASGGHIQIAVFQELAHCDARFVRMWLAERKKNGLVQEVNLGIRYKKYYKTEVVK